MKVGLNNTYLVHSSYRILTLEKGKLEIARNRTENKKSENEQEGKLIEKRLVDLKIEEKELRRDLFQTARNLSQSTCLMDGQCQHPGLSECKDCQYKKGYLNKDNCLNIREGGKKINKKGRIFYLL